MTEPRLPPGRYFSCPIDVRAEYGGQTRALLMRNRIFAAEAGIRPTVLMFGAASDMDARRAALLERGLITPQIELLNIYEHYRSHDWPSTTALDRPLMDVSAYRRSHTSLADGSPFQVTYELPDGRALHEYLRADGSPYLRVPDFTFRDRASWPKLIQLISKDGELVGEHPSIGSWFRSWIDELAPPDQDSYLFIDSRYIAPHLAPIDRPQVHLIYLLHNIHVSGDRSWNGPLNDEYRRLLGHLADMDAFVTLTVRQRTDIAERLGSRSHLFVVPNPVDLPRVPEQVRRDPRLVTVVARIEGQKRLGHALRAFHRVVGRVPDARLEIYGEGSRRAQLETLTENLGLSDSVTFKGHDPSAREALWHSSAFLLTSQFEGYPLSTLESLSHGCPVIAYDIKYGPREQITDGIDGFLVPEGDIEAVADRIVQLLEDPALVERMSAAARRKAAQHGPERFLADWEHVVSEARKLKPLRTRIRAATVSVRTLRVRRGVFSRLAHRRGSDRLQLDARIRVDAAPTASTLEQAEVTLDVVHGDGDVTPLPVQTSVSADGIRVRSRANLREVGLLEAPASREGAVLRLRVVWQNDAWETAIGRPSPGWSDVVRD